MKIKNLLLLIIALMPMELMAQSDIGLSVSYLPSDTTILIHKAGKEISLYDAAFFEGIDYQRFIDINPHSTKTFRYRLKFLCPSSHSATDVYSVDVSCFMNYSIPEKELYEFFHKVLSVKTK